MGTLNRLSRTTLRCVIFLSVIKWTIGNTSAETVWFGNIATFTVPSYVLTSSWTPKPLVSAIVGIGDGTATFAATFLTGTSMADARAVFWIDADNDLTTGSSFSLEGFHGGDIAIQINGQSYYGHGVVTSRTNGPTGVVLTNLYSGPANYTANSMQLTVPLRHFLGLLGSSSHPFLVTSSAGTAYAFSPTLSYGVGTLVASPEHTLALKIGLNGGSGAVTLDGATIAVTNSAGSTMPLAVGMSGQLTLGSPLAPPSISGTLLSVTGENAGLLVGNGRSETLTVGADGRVSVSGANGFVDVTGTGTVSVNRGLLETRRLVIGAGGFVSVSNEGSIRIDTPGTGVASASNPALRVVQGAVDISGTLEVSRRRADLSSAFGGAGNTVLAMGLGGIPSITAPGSSLRVNPEGTLRVISEGIPHYETIPVRVFEGSFDVERNGRLEFSIKGQPTPTSSSLLVRELVSGWSNARISDSARVNVSLPDWNPTRPGETAALMAATSIRGDAVGTPRIAAFSASAASNAFRLMPETISAGCNLFLESVSGCGVDILGVRTVRNVSSSPMKPPERLPTLRGLGDAKAFVTNERATVGARLSDDIYRLSGQPVNGEVSRIDLDGLRAMAYDTTYAGGASGREITIVIRGTEMDGYIKQNMAANLGFGGIPTSVQRAYLQNISEFSSSVLAANPGANMRFVGHSLGGGLAMILGAATGFDAYGYNAPPVGMVLPLVFGGMFDKELSAFSERIPRATDPTSIDLHNIVNIRSSLDGISTLVLARPEMGQFISIAPDPLLYCAQRPLACLLLPQVGGIVGTVLRMFPGTTDSITAYHSISSLYASLAYKDPVVLDVSYNGTLIEAAPQLVITDELDSRVLMPDPGSTAITKLLTHRPVVPFLEHYLDPDSSEGWMFQSNPGSPLFYSVRPPELGDEELRFSVQIFVDGEWKTVSVLSAEELFLFPGEGVSRFRLLVNKSLPSDVTDTGIFFGVAFASGGEFNGSIQAIPEPSAYVLMCLGLLLIWLMTQRSTSIRMGRAVSDGRVGAVLSPD